MKKVVLACFLVACGPPANPLVDAFVNRDEGTPDAPPDGPPVMRSGLVSVSQTATDADASAVFAIGDVFGTALGTDGPCKVTQNPVTSGLSAGAITVSGTATPLTLSPHGTAPNVDYETMPAAPNTLFTAGATITVHAAGSPEFPAFDATVTAPAALLGFTPPAAISRAGYTAHWTAGTANTWVIMVASNGTPAPAFVICKVADTGSFAIPASTFALIPAGYNMAAIGVGRVGEQDVTTSAGVVTVTAVSDITSQFVPLNP